MNRRQRMRSHQEFLLIAAAIFPLLATGCRLHSPPGRDPLSGQVREEIYRRMNVEFAEALLFKPREQDPTNTTAFALAPLILLEVTGGNGIGGVDVAAQNGHSAQLSSGGGIERIDCFEEKILVRGRPHDRWTYWWRRAQPADAGTEAIRPSQGVRLTLDAAGQPVIWEILADTSGAAIFFVAESLEADAAAEFGRALPGRQFAVERGLKEVPDAVVARVIADGPQPMGPVVHLRSDSRDISTVTCRCMPVQVERLVGQRDYELTVLPRGPTRSLWPGVRSRTRENDSGLPAPAGERSIEETLRLPSSF